MKPYYPVRTYGIFMMLLSCLLLFNSCNKLDYEVPDSSHLLNVSSNPGSTVVGNVSGFVTDETDQPVPGASVQAGNMTTHTDQFGYFEINNTELLQNAAMVTVQQPGYFKGIKTFIAVVGQEAFFRIKLIPKSTAGTFNGSLGGTLSLPNGLNITFMPAGIINATSGESYTGNVNVAAYWINPVASDLNRIMPGDQRAIAADGTLKQLTTFGMAAVELTGASGELLQIAPGKKATLGVTIPASILAYAPATIPLWYFDEKTGLWSEQGTAVKSGNTYSGDVSHFSFWNFDISGEFIHLNGTVTDAAGNPLKNVLVKIALQNNPHAAAYGFTNAQGYFSGAVPANSTLVLEITGGAECGTPLYSKTFTTANSDIALGKMIVDAQAGLAGVTGIITDCSGNPSPYAVVIMQKNGQFYRTKADKNGRYAITTSLCNSTAAVELQAYDLASAKYSETAQYIINTTKTTNADLQACGNTSSQYINYTINGVSYYFTYPADYFAPVTPDQYFTFAVSNSNTDEAGFQFSGADILGNGPKPLSYFMASQIHDNLIMSSPVMVNLTEKGENDQVFAGKFSGIFTGTGTGHKQYNISCSFRVKCTL